MDIFVRIIEITFPIFSIVAIGLFCGKRFNLDMSTANRLNMDVFVPALLFSVMVGQSVDVREYVPLIIAATFVVLGSGILILPIAKLSGINLKTLAPPVMFNNAGNMGLPLMVLTFGEAVLPIAMIVFLVENTLHFTLGTAWLNNTGKSSLRAMISPLTVATFVAIALGISNISIHPTLLMPIDLLGQIVIPLMLFSLGVRLSTSSFKTLKIGLVGGIASPVTGLVSVFIVLPFVELTAIEAGVLFLFGALPPAILNFMFAERYQQEPEKVASMVIIGNALSIITLPLVLSYVIPRFVAG
ncbi:MAG: AEC family transporter [Cellvibrionaceae bacterium]